MASLESSIADALRMEETGLIDSLIFVIRQFNSVYMHPSVKDRFNSLINRLLSDTIRHSNMLSKELSELIK